MFSFDDVIMQSPFYQVGHYGDEILYNHDRIFVGGWSFCNALNSNHFF